MLEAPNVRIVFEVWDPSLGCFVLESQHLRIIFELLEPGLGCVVLETQHLRIIFEVLDQPIGPNQSLPGHVLESGVSVLDLRSEVKIYSCYVIFRLAPKR